MNWDNHSPKRHFYKKKSNVISGSLQPFFRKFLKLAKEEQELIKEQNQLLEKILQAQEMRVNSSVDQHRQGTK